MYNRSLELYNTLSTFLTSIGCAQIAIIFILLVIKILRSYNTTPYSAISVFTSAAFMNVLFINLKIIGCLKLLICCLRALVRSRKFTLLASKSEEAHSPRDRAKSIHAMDNLCVICRDELCEVDSSEYKECENDDDMPTLILKCGHCFHSDCFRSWFLKNDSCPVCRSTV
ncbi:unnamed protein product [Ambrosiozyma monospora]|uniref:Unnamed protein product n=1 Tax=Ambrosiozyma monospora TaxID=43982 RepID=A0A9W7DCD7_AMBMO|nr:unnamed protein product [Ambrosiozyma monospora]